jgi:hypothetical protein
MQGYMRTSMATSVSKSDALSWSFCGILTLIQVHCKMKSCPVEVLVRTMFLCRRKGPQRSIVVGGGLWHARHLGEDCCAQQTGVHRIGCGSTAYSLFYLGSELILADITKHLSVEYLSHTI